MRPLHCAFCGVALESFDLLIVPHDGNIGELRLYLAVPSCLECREEDAIQQAERVRAMMAKWGKQ